MGRSPRPPCAGPADSSTFTAQVAVPKYFLTVLGRNGLGLLFTTLQLHSKECVLRGNWTRVQRNVDKVVIATFLTTAEP